MNTAFPILLLLTLCVPGKAGPADGLTDLDYLRVVPPEPAADDVARNQQEDAVVQSRKAAFKAFQAALPAQHPGLLVREGVMADASNRVVRIWAWTTHVRPGEPVEFFLSNLRGGRQYESSFVTDALPSDIDAALRHIGLKPGWPFDPAQKQLWPKGDRVVIEVLRAAAGREGALLPAVRIESSCKDGATGGPAGPFSHVFTGSKRVPDPADPSRQVYAADEFDPMSISSNYNLVNTVLDLPDRRPKEAVYGQMVLADPPLTKPFQPVIITVRPDPGSPPGGIPDLKLVAGGTSAAMTLSLQGAGDPLAGGLDDLARMITGAKKGAGLAHLTVALDPAHALRPPDLRKLASRLQQLEDDGVVRIDPPAPGTLYYRAWNPDPALLERSGRTLQPWELHLQKGAGGLAGQLVIVEEEWPGNATDPVLHETRLPLESAADLREKTTRLAEDRPAVLLVITSDDIPVRDIMAFIDPVQSAFPVIYVFGGSTPSP
ncbi:MAG: hypothetical protein U1F77_09690 [Kiritimatiellia bacterium]